MRVIITKIFYQSHHYYVLPLILLLSCTDLIAKESTEASNELLQSAQQQQHFLLKKYPLSTSILWPKKCHELIESLGLEMFNSCTVIQAQFANAYSLAHGVVILTEGLLKNIHNDDQLAHILAHEHAHLILNHHQQTQQLLKNPPKLFTKSRIKKFYRHLEVQADLAADDLLTSQNLDPSQIHHYLIRLVQTSNEHSSDHQKLNDRIKRDGLPDEKIETFWITD